MLKIQEVVLGLSLFLIAAFGSPAGATDPVPKDSLPIYEKGSGATYDLTLNDSPTEVTIGFMDQTAKKLVIEITMQPKNEGEGLNLRMAQQFHLGLVNGKIQILKGLLKIPMVEKPQILPAEYLEGFNGVQVKSFLIGSAQDLDDKKIGSESITANGKKYSTVHYRHTENGQTIDYWVSDQAKPMGLVKLTSKGSSTQHNYNMLLKGTRSNLKAEIDESRAEPLNSTAKSFLPLLIPGLSNKL